MWIFPARFGTVFVDAAFVVRSQEKARRLIQNPISVFIDMQVFFCE
jgi:hypothetical protein